MRHIKFEEERKRVLRTCMDLCDQGLVDLRGMAGNVSLRIPETDFIAITPTQVRYDTMKPEDVLIVDTDGEVIHGKDSRRPTSEVDTHTLVHEEIEGAKAVIHSHGLYAVTLSTLYDDIPPVYVDQAYFLGSKVPVIDHVSPGTIEMAEAVVSKLKERASVVIKHHGIVTFGEDLREAFIRSVSTEDNARIYYQALCLGEPEILSEDEIEEMRP